ncbi:TonB-dependent receptor [Pseudoxanthomonas daejeonensis]|uniref:Oar protein n=1 Tax=Pseudoxanthomonas daejeonensis TaxID=266062 RepID=A0ABQ6Z7X9_9GAMM|nr:TonB-dependent receptor [Pseudoxanthomonas daejeonensis]KAF1695118.1 Oar protein [Pseudoxanthomonas daejeonensis]UNK56108.1 TonB-dependent receptor [Pseudoxanthomonas daejeonensis]
MKRSSLNRNLRRSALTVALGLCFTSAVHAQQATGALFGQAASGETVVIENPATGFRRELVVGADGGYRVPSIQPGSYRVTLKRADGSTAVRDVTVSVGTGTPVNFAAGGGTTQLDGVTVVGTRAVNPIDVSSVASTSILTAEQMAKIPVLRDATSVALLAPGTVRGDTAFGNLASFGGSSVAENQYYVNGFNITNSYRSLNFAQVPFEAIAEQQTMTGGYGSEFGRSLGGVVNQVTKRGTNDFQAGGNIFWSPDSLRSEVANTYYSNPLVPGDLGKLRQDNSNDTLGGMQAAVWAGGALVKDKLFAYGVLTYSKVDREDWGTVLSRTNTDESEKGDPTWLVKLDWNITDDHHLEFTGLSDKRTTTTKTYLNTVGELDRGNLVGTSYAESGGENYVFRYTGYLTEAFTVSALYGTSDYSRSRRLVTADGQQVEYGGDLNQPATGCPVITDIRPGYRQAITGAYSSSCNITGTSIDRVDSKDTRDQFRLDFDWEIGDHRVGFGYDTDDFESVAGTSLEGGRIWRYSTNNGPDGLANTGDEFDIVREQIVNQGSTVRVEQHAYYLEDNWQVTDTFQAYIGLRWDTFENFNGEGDAYVKIENQFAPRLGFSWDVNGDSSWKVYGTAGRYALPLTSSVAVRGASASLFTRQNFNFTGVDPVTGAPIGLTPRAALSYINGEFGEPKNAATIASKNLDPMYQDEYILGTQYQLTEHQSVGVKGTYRKLKAAIDDNCDYTPIFDMAVADGLDPVLPSSGFPYCRMFNPGADSVFVTDIENNGVMTEYTIPGELLSPPAKRSYEALELFWDGSWDKWFASASYTMAWNKGNTEGGVKSDIGQSDTSVTQDFDYKELAVDSYGYLPNDRRHSLKVFGNYQINDEWSAGGNLLVQSGRPINCLGVLYPYHGGIHPYGASFFRCGTTEAGGVNGPSEPVPRGTAGRLPWTNSIDLNIAYFPKWASGLAFKIDVFNVFDSQKVTSVTEVAEDGTTGVPLNTYLVPRSFQAPRSVRFMVQYDF